jgi:uncharacterized protein (TIGR02453 family)
MIRNVTSPFTTKTLSFLRALKRNNRREWFQPRKDDYDTHVRAPMVALLERLSVDLRTFAPELIAEPKVSMFRIYRDTRFSNDKSPYKTHVAARFPLRGVPRGEGAGLYFEIAPGWVWIGGGMYMPTHPRGLHKVVSAPPFKRAVGDLTGDRLTRVPLGYRKDHPAAHYLQFKQFLGSCEYEPSLATSRSFYSELLKVFKAVAPLVQFLNRAIEPRLTQAPVLVNEEPPRSPRQTVAPRPLPEPMW